MNNEKDATIKLLSKKIDTLEDKLKQLDNLENEEVQKSSELTLCEYCDFSAKNKRGLQLHMKSKHEITKVEIQVFCRATEKYLSSDRDLYKKELESEIDALEDVVDMDMDSSKIYDYVGQFLPTKLILRTRIPAQWLESESFRKEIWERINKRIPKGKISEDKDGKD
jgi:vacuolar-type H+-ATPase subunit I/STV1